MRAREPENMQEKMRAAAYAAYKRGIIESGRDFDAVYDSEDLEVFTLGYESAACAGELGQLVK